MSQIAATWPAAWPARPSQSLAGQSATVVQRDGSRRVIRFGSDVQLRPSGSRPSGAASVPLPVVEGHLDAGQHVFDPEDRDLVLRDGSVFRICFSHQSFFFAIAPLVSRLRAAIPA